MLMNDMSLEDLNQLVVEWAENKGIFESATVQDQMEKTYEELAEVTDEIEAYGSAILGGSTNDVSVIEHARNKVCLEYGDVLVTLLIQLAMLDLTPNECLQAAYEKISVRKGKMVGGKFVKEGDY